MKTSLLILSFIFTIAFGSGETNTDNVVDDFVCSNWVEVDPGCDNHFWLCTDNYSNTFELIDAAVYFSNGRCDD
jgi:hypothetical protein